MNKGEGGVSWASRSQPGQKVLYPRPTGSGGVIGRKLEVEEVGLSPSPHRSSPRRQSIETLNRTQPLALDQTLTYQALLCFSREWGAQALGACKPRMNCS